MSNQPAYHATRILADLISFPVLGGQSNLSILQYLTDYLTNAGIDFQLAPNNDGSKASLHCRIGPAVDGGVILSGHMDVVTVDGQDWQSNPFEMTEKDGRLYGRGTCDMKGFLACCLAALPKMQKAALKKPIYFAFSYDEEIGCLAAPALAKAIRENYSETPACAIIGEPSLMQPVTGHKGMCVYDTTIRGSTGHSSRIRQEVSAIHEAARLILWLEKQMKNLIDKGHIDKRFDPPHTSLHVGTIHGGIAFNVIAEGCTFRWDIRVIPKDDPEEIVNRFERHCRQQETLLRRRFPGFQITTREYHPPVPPLSTAEDQPVVDLIRKLSGAHTLQTVAYAAEAGQFAEAGFPAVICGPGSIEQAHRPNEFISKDQLEKGVRFIQKLVGELSS